MDKQDKINKNKYLILSNPNESANKLYNKSKSLGLGMRKTDFLKLVRDLRNIPEKTQQEKEKHVPTKYKTKPKAIKTDVIYTNKQIKKKTQYGLSEITAYMDNMEQQTFYIKYKNKKDFNRQLDIILQHYKVQSYEITSYGVHYYKPFIDSGFQKTLTSWNINP